MGLTAAKISLSHLMRDPAFRREFALDQTTVSIAQQIRDHRKKRGISQSKLAELCGAKQAVISRIESGDEPPTIRNLCRIASALNLDVRITLED